MFLDDLASRLVAAGVGTLGVNLFLSSTAVIPTGNGPYITLTETGGTSPVRTQNAAAAATQRPTAQIAVRGASYGAVRQKAKDAYYALDGTWNTVLNGVTYLSITARQEPTDIGLDEAGRATVVFNVDAVKQPS